MKKVGQKGFLKCILTATWINKEMNREQLSVAVLKIVNLIIVLR